jgi:hypothetical protein
VVWPLEQARTKSVYPYSYSLSELRPTNTGPTTPYPAVSKTATWGIYSAVNRLGTGMLAGREDPLDALAYAPTPYVLSSVQQVKRTSVLDGIRRVVASAGTGLVAVRRLRDVCKASKNRIEKPTLTGRPD